MRKLQNYALRGYVTLCIIAAPIGVSAQGVGQGLEDAAGQAGYNPNVQIEGIVGGLVNAILALLGVAFIVLLVYAGILYLTARGDKDQVGKAKRLIRQAIIGIIIVSTSYIIANFVVTELVTLVGNS